MQVLYQGAESIIYIETYDGEKAIVKERIPKSYRIRQLDDPLRKSRTRKEVRLLTEARKIGVSTPRIIHVDESKHKIIMEYVEGERLKEFLESADIDHVKSVCVQLGMIIGQLHSNGIAHGDLTTSNIISRNGDLYFIDFSLGDFTQRIEDIAVDLRLLKEAIKSTHFSISEEAWKSILDGYRKTYKKSDAVLSQLKEIESRVRYANRE